MRTWTKLTAASAMALAAVTVSTGAQAALVTSWAHSYTNDWANPTYTGPQAGNATFKGSCVTGGYDRIYWGSPGGNPPGSIAQGTPASCNDSSSLDVTDSASGSLTTDAVLVNTNTPNVQDAGFWTPGATLRHNNLVIWNTASTGISLSTVDINFSLTLTPTAPSGATLAPLNVVFNLQFQETPNVAGTCDAVVSAETPCPDYFILLNPTNLVQTFTLDDYQYWLTLDLDFANAANVIQDPSNPLKFWTRENTTATLPTRFKIEAAQVPEPASLALLGLGLAGLGFRRRRG